MGWSVRLPKTWDRLYEFLWVKKKRATQGTLLTWRMVWCKCSRILTKYPITLVYRTHLVYRSHFWPPLGPDRLYVIVKIPASAAVACLSALIVACTVYQNIYLTYAGSRHWVLRGQNDYKNVASRRVNLRRAGSKGCERSAGCTSHEDVCH